jgi:hypothetical protein
MTLVQLLMAILIFAVVMYLITFLPDNRLRKIFQVVVVVLAVIWLLRGLFGVYL